MTRLRPEPVRCARLGCGVPYPEHGRALGCRGFLWVDEPGWSLRRAGELSGPPRYAEDSRASRVADPR